MTDKSGSPHRRYELLFKRQVVAETFVDGATIAAAARRHGINVNMLFLWQRHKRFNGGGDKPPPLLPIAITPNATAVEGRAGGLYPGQHQIDIEVGGKVHVRCLEDISKPAIPRVLSVLRQSNRPG